MALIEREAFRRELLSLTYYGDGNYYSGREAERDSIIDRLNEQPTIDPIKAAGGCYCRECRYWSEDGRCDPGENGLIREYTKSTDFCSYGESREAQDDG